jgi:hypothetical protein
VISHLPSCMILLDAHCPLKRTFSEILNHLACMESKLSHPASRSDETKDQSCFAHIRDKLPYIRGLDLGDQSLLLGAELGKATTHHHVR